VKVLVLSALFLFHLKNNNSSAHCCASEYIYKSKPYFILEKNKIETHRSFRSQTLGKIIASGASKERVNFKWSRIEVGCQSRVDS
jgi:hypothetical protein